MAITRKFLGWKSPLLRSVVDDLVATHRRDNVVDLRDATCVFPVSRAGRRFLEILVLRCETLGVGVLPPRIISVGELADVLLPGTYRFAPPLERQSAWVAALRSLPERDRLLIVRPKEDPIPLSYMLAVARRLESLASELGGALLQPRDIGTHLPTDAPPSDEARWGVLQSVFDHYNKVLSGRGYIDKHRAIVGALERKECSLEGTLLLVNTIDLTSAARLMIQQLPHVVSYLMAPEDLSQSFDEVGCCRVEQWISRDFIPGDPYSAGGVSSEKVIVVEFDRDQSAAVASRLASVSAGHGASEVTVGVCRGENGTIVSDYLVGQGVPVRNAAGTPFARSRLGVLVTAIVSYVRNPSSVGLYALCRHPDIERWLTARVAFSTPLTTQLDRFHQLHLPSDLDVRDPPAPLKNLPALAEVCAHLREVLIPLFTGGRVDLTEWLGRVHQVLVSIVPQKDLKERTPLEERAWECWTSILESVRGEGGAAFHSLTPSDAFALLHHMLKDAIINPEPSLEAVEVLGWLELVLDDAPVLIVTDFNEGVVPESVNEDAFLPNALRMKHKLLDNDRRFARDLCAFAMMVRSRPETTIIVPRYSEQGESRPPSRLLLQCAPEGVAARLESLMTPWHVDSGSSKPNCKGTEQASVLGPYKPVSIPTVTQVNVSGLRDYLECPYRYYLKRVCKLSTSDDSDREMSAPVFGNLAHEVLASLKDSVAGHATDPKIVASFLMDELSRKASQQLGSWAYATAHVQIEQLRQRLSCFAQWQAAHAAEGWRIRDTEVSVPSGVVVIPTAHGAISLVGRIDRIDERSDGSVCIFDYKTGAYSPDKMYRERFDVWVDPQLVAYRMMMRAQGTKGEISVGIISIEKDLDAIGGMVPKWSEDVFQSGERTIRDVVEKIAAGIFWPPSDRARSDSDLAPFFVGYRGGAHAG